MATILSIISDYTPANGATGVPLRNPITITFSCLMDEDELEEDFFVAGPDTDQFVGPGVAEFQQYPDNVSQGDDFLESPGYTGIVQGAFSFATVSGKTVMTFTPTQPMAALTAYTAYLPEATSSGGTEYTGQVTWSWTTGSGSIVELPANMSTSVLTSLNQNSDSLTSQSPLEVVKTTPKENAIQQNPDTLKEIVIEFNKDLSVASINSDNVQVKGYPASEHPSASSTHNDELATVLTVRGNVLTIKI